MRVLALNKIHHQILALLRKEKVVGHSWQIRMRGANQNARLAFQLILNRRRDIKTFLNSHRNAHVQIPGTIYCARIILAEENVNAIAIIQNLADGERHLPPRYMLLVPRLKQREAEALDGPLLNSKSRSDGL